MTVLERLVGVEREAPPLLVHRLREIEPSAELVYMGDNTWWLGRVHPSLDLRKQGWEKLQVANAGTHQHRIDPRHARLYRIGRLQQLGFQFTTEYTGEPDGRIVEDLIRADYLWKLASNWYRYQEIRNGAQDAEAEQARAELMDDARARDAWRYMSTLSHSVKRHGPSDYRSGRTTVSRIS